MYRMCQAHVRLRRDALQLNLLTDDVVMQAEHSVQDAPVLLNWVCTAENDAVPGERTVPALIRAFPDAAQLTCKDLSYWTALVMHPSGWSGVFDRG